MSNKVENIEDSLKHRVAETICINCKHRWVAVYPATTPLIDLECPGCHESGYVITTGEIADDYVEWEWEEE